MKKSGLTRSVLIDEEEDFVVKTAVGGDFDDAYNLEINKYEVMWYENCPEKYRYLLAKTWSDDKTFKDINQERLVVIELEDAPNHRLREIGYSPVNACFVFFDLDFLFLDNTGRFVEPFENAYKKIPKLMNNLLVANANMLGKPYERER